MSSPTILNVTIEEYYKLKMADKFAAAKIIVGGCVIKNRMGTVDGNVGKLLSNPSTKDFLLSPSSYSKNLNRNKLCQSVV